MPLPVSGGGAGRAFMILRSDAQLDARAAAPRPMYRDIYATRAVVADATACRLPGAESPRQRRHRQISRREMPPFSGRAWRAIRFRRLSMRAAAATMRARYSRELILRAPRGVTPGHSSASASAPFSALLLIMPFLGRHFSSTSASAAQLYRRTAARPRAAARFRVSSALCYLIERFYFSYLL